MEYAQGGELFDLICRENMNENDARKIFQQIIFGVEYLHTHQVCLRDLKLENILLDEENNVKLADFGLSNIMRDGIFLYSSCGSPNYAAPELINGKYYNGSSIDIWSCGVILYTLLTGMLPFNEKQTAKLYQKIRECKYVLPENLSDPAKDLILRMLQKDPLNRISISEIKQHKWFMNKLNLFQVIDNHRYIYGSRNQIDKDVIHQMTVSNKINPENYSEEELSQKITTKERKDLCTIYEFLENQKNENQFREKKVKLKNEINFFKRIKIEKNTEDYLNRLKNKLKNKTEIKSEENKMSVEEEINEKPKDKISEMISKNKKGNELWRVGIICKKECYHLTTEILKILKKNGYEWKIISSSYKIKCRKKQNEDMKNNSINNSTEPEITPLNVLIQIFGEVDPQQKDEFLVDLHKLSGPVMEFLEFSSIFISAIQKQGLIVLK